MSTNWQMDRQIWYIHTMECACMLSCFSGVWIFVTLWTVAHQAPQSMGFSRQEYWSGLSCPPPGDLPDPGIEPMSLEYPELAGRFFTSAPPGKCVVLQCSSSVVSDSLRPRESQHTRPPCPSPTPRVHSDSSPSSQWCHPAISSSVVPSPSAPNPSQHQSLFQWVNSSHEVAKVLEFQL